MKLHIRDCEGGESLIFQCPGEVEQCHDDATQETGVMLMVDDYIGYIWDEAVKETVDVGGGATPMTAWLLLHLYSIQYIEGC